MNLTGKDLRLDRRGGDLIAVDVVVFVVVEAEDGDAATPPAQARRRRGELVDEERRRQARGDPDGGQRRRHGDVRRRRHDGDRVERRQVAKTGRVAKTGQQKVGQETQALPSRPVAALAGRRQRLLPAVTFLILLIIK